MPDPAVIEEFRPKQSLGQNFLVDENIARKIVRCFAPKPEDTVLEIGPGFGVLTKYLLPVGCRVIAVEIDARLVAELQRRYGHEKKLVLLHQDVRQVSLRDYGSPQRPLRVLGNIPYHITSPVIFALLENRQVVKDALLTIQREVAERIVSRPRSKGYGILSVLCQAVSRPKIEFTISRNVFYPKPEVESAVIHLDFRDGGAALRFEDEKLFFEVVKTAFGQRRKILRNALRSLHVEAEVLGAHSERRAEELTVEEFVDLANRIARKHRARERSGG